MDQITKSVVNVILDKAVKLQKFDSETWNGARLLDVLQVMLDSLDVPKDLTLEQRITYIQLLGTNE